MTRNLPLAKYAVNVLAFVNPRSGKTIIFLAGPDVGPKNSELIACVKLLFVQLLHEKKIPDHCLPADLHIVMDNASVCRICCARCCSLRH